MTLYFKGRLPPPVTAVTELLLLAAPAQSIPTVVPSPRQEASFGRGGGMRPQNTSKEEAAILCLASEQDGEIHQVQLGEQLLPVLFS